MLNCKIKKLLKIINTYKTKYFNDCNIVIYKKNTMTYFFISKKNKYVYA